MGRVARKPVQTLGKPEMIIIYSLFLPVVVLSHNYFFPLKEQIKELEDISELIPNQLRDMQMQLWNIPDLHESLASRSAEVITKY